MKTKHFYVLLSLIFSLVLRAEDPEKTEPAPVPVRPAAESTAPVAGDQLDQAITRARAERKMLFVTYGWDKCGNCRNLDKLISSGQVKIDEKEFVVTNVHPRIGNDRNKFARYYGIQSGIYPRIVIAGPTNNKLASRTGYGFAKDYNALIDQARKANTVQVNEAKEAEIESEPTVEK